MAVQFPPLRDFQAKAHQALRQGFKDGHKNQLIMAPTGSGKTILAMWIIHGVLQKGRRAVFVCDRTALINQTSQVADGLGLTDHAIVQAQHPRRDTSRPLQIASIQTISKRGYWPDADVVVVDEAHAQYKSWVEYAKQTKSVVLGLSATPFSKGLGKVFTNLVNVTSMHELTQAGILVPMKVFSCTQMDMKDAEKDKGGEWTERAAEQRGKAIIGDVVSEWLKLSSERKTIVFGATIKHCEEMAAKFLDAGVMAAVYTSETKEDERLRLLTEFKKPDSILRVLLTVEALAKGFDQADVSCVVDCRPLSKSLSTAIQMWGRGLRSHQGKINCHLHDHCIASGQRVLTDRGLVAIENIQLTDRLWDGVEFVEHKGVVSRGYRTTIQYAGLTATPDHPVKTAKGWRTLGQCSEEQEPIITTGAGRTALWECGNYFTRGDLAWPASSALHACALRVRHLWLSIHHFVGQFAKRQNQRVSDMQPASAGCASVALFKGCEHEEEVRQSKRPEIQGLRRSWDTVPFRLSDHLRSLDSGELRDTCGTRDDGAGPNRQQRSLRAGEHQVVESSAEYVKHQGQQTRPGDAQVQARAPGSDLLRRIFKKSYRIWSNILGNRGEVGSECRESKAETWDVLDCGPRNSFTCEGLLVHNSGNIIRMAEDFTEVYFNGLAALDDGEKLDKKQRDTDEPEVKDSACPACGYKPFFKRCMACGHEKQAPSDISHEPGVMQEITIGKGKHKTKLADDHRHLWDQVASYARIHSAPEKQPYLAKHLFTKIAGFQPPSEWAFSTTPDVPVTDGVHRKIRSINIAFARGKGK